MANDFQEIGGKILALSNIQLRKLVPTIIFINNQFVEEPKEKGDTIDIILPPEIQAQPVIPGYIPQPANDLSPKKVPLTLDNWEEAAFNMTDADFEKVVAGVLPMSMSSAIAGLAEKVNSSVLSNYKKIWGWVGTAGVTPFANSTIEAQEARMVLAKQKAPRRDRFLMMGVEADSNAVGLPAFQDASRAGTDLTITEAEIGRKLGMNWYCDETELVHVAGAPVNGWHIDGAGQSGTRLHIDNNGSGTPSLPVEGDIFTLPGSDQTYAVYAVIGGDPATGIDVEIMPAITYGTSSTNATPPVNNAPLTFKPTHVVNLAYQKFCFAFASRRMADPEPLGSSVKENIMTMVDPITGLALRFEVSRWHKQTRYAFDLMWGSECVLPQLGCRIAG